MTFIWVYVSDFEKIFIDYSCVSRVWEIFSTKNSALSMAQSEK